MRWKAKQIPEWKTWLAWYPVYIQEIDSYVWLEYIVRKGTINATFTHIDYIYRVIKHKERYMDC